jgi:hypothetical protein
MLDMFDITSGYVMIMKIVGLKLACKCKEIDFNFKMK